MGLVGAVFNRQIPTISWRSPRGNFPAGSPTWMPMVLEAQIDNPGSNR